MMSSRARWTSLRRLHTPSEKILGLALSTAEPMGTGDSELGADCSSQAESYGRHSDPRLLRALKVNPHLELSQETNL